MSQPIPQLLAGYQRAGYAFGPPSLAPFPAARGSSQAGVRFLQDQFENARLLVEVAWGADVEGDPNEWTWTDITTDVMQADGQRIQITIGRADEASNAQPAKCTMRLDNRSGDYSLGGQSKNWPNVKRNVPLRVRVDLGLGPITRFFGHVTGFSPGWDTTGNYAVANLVVNGVTRRLSQGDTPVDSVFKKAINSDQLASVFGYWPVEEEENATQIASGVPGGKIMNFSGNPTFSTNNDMPGSKPLAVMNGAIFWADVTPLIEYTEVQFRMFISVPAGGGDDNTHLMWMLCTGTAPLWAIDYRTGGGDLHMKAYNTSGALVVDQSINFDIDGVPSQIGLELVQNGANVDWQITQLEVGATGSTQFSNTLVGHTFGAIVRAQVNFDSSNDGFAFGHVTLQSEITSNIESIDLLNAYFGESTVSEAGRLFRLCGENSLELTLYDGDGAGSFNVDFMGYQEPENLVTLLREVEAVDQGILWDGFGPGVQYTTRRRRENHTAVMTLDASAGELAMPFAPVDDDKSNRNKVTVIRKGGSNATFEDADGPMGTATIGEYAESATINFAEDEYAMQYATWLVHLGTVEGYRHPTLTMNLAKNPHLAATWMDVIPGSRVDVTNLADVRTQYWNADLSCQVLGWTEEISQFTWDVELNTAPFDGWRIAVLSEDSGDTDEFLCHLDSDGSTLQSAVDAGATSLSVVTPSGLWTTDADDFPFDISVGGVQATVTAVSGASSPQTFTIDPLSVGRPGGVDIEIWKPQVLGL